MSEISPTQMKVLRAMADGDTLMMVTGTHPCAFLAKNFMPVRITTVHALSQAGLIGITRESVSGRDYGLTQKGREHALRL